ncbi:MAG TPA: hypothetical protein VMH61_05120 [Candidatus Acidoferrales bacterium]|nr:hypothetical protein [Candidatus Acidoferrales bacterium]
MRHLPALCAALLLFGAAPASAQLYGQMTGAVPLAVDQRQFGASVGFTSSQLEVLGQLRLCFYPNLDFGFHGGLTRVDLGPSSRTAVEMGTDFKTLVHARTENFPADLALGAAIGITSADGYDLLSLGPLVVASRTYAMGTNANITPYAGAVLMFTRADLSAQNSTNVSLPLRFGVQYAPAADFRLCAELQAAINNQISDNPKFVLGANFPF